MTNSHPQLRIVTGSDDASSTRKSERDHASANATQAGLTEGWPCVGGAQDNADATGCASTTFHTDWQSLCSSFSEATGHVLAFRGPRDPAFPSSSVWETEVPATGPHAPGILGLLTSSARSNASRTSDSGGESSDPSLRLAQHVGGLVKQLHAAQRTLWHRNAELATAIPMIVDSREETNQLAERLSSLLKSAARVATADSAVMFLLDDTTEHLQLRAHHGLTHDRFTDPHRMLSQCPADVQALAGHAIVLEDARDRTTLLPDLFDDSDSRPEAAVCIPISTATVPLGTLWVFADRPTTFSDVQLDMIEIIAGRLATELEREILLREQGALGNRAHVQDAVDWQRGQVPSVSQIEGEGQRYDLATRASSRSRLHGDHFGWQMNPTRTGEQLAFTVSTNQGRGLAAALGAARMHGLMDAALESSDAVSPAECVSRLNGALWKGSAGDDQASFFFGQMNLDTGKLRLSAAGMIDVFVIRPHGWEPIARLNTTPLGAIDESQTVSHWECTLHSGDTLLVLSGRPRLRARDIHDGQVDGPHFAEALLHHNHLDLASQTLLLSGLWDHETSPWAAPPAQLLVTRQ